MFGIGAFWVAPNRLPKIAIGIRPSTLLRFHRALIQRKYRLLFTPRTRQRPGPKGPSKQLIAAILEMKRRNPQFGCPRIAQEITHAFGVEPADIDGVAVCRMFNHAISGQPLPKHLSTDNDPLFRFHRWRANLRVLEIDVINTVPFVPCSHPFVERLIGTIRREYLDHLWFWNRLDLQRKLARFARYYNQARVHSALTGKTPAAAVAPTGTCRTLAC